MDKPNNTPPPWSEAPLWAMWRAQDRDGWWGFYRVKPFPDKDIWSNDEVILDGENYLLSYRGDPNPNWRESLQKRPENE